MAYLEDIPKYAFGTAYAIDWSANLDDAQSKDPSDDDQSKPDTQADAPTQPPSGETTSTKPDTNGTMKLERANVFTPGQVKQLVSEAIDLGVRHFDCAPLYKTQPLIGEVMRTVFLRIPRQQFFFSSKVPPNMMRPENLERSVRKSIDELQVSYLDLVLLHAPFSTKYVSDDEIYPVDESGNLLLDDTEEHEQSLLLVAWKKLNNLKELGLCRYIGLSNVNMEQLIRLNAVHHVDVVQNEYHIYQQDRDIFDYCEEIDVHFEGYAAFGSPLVAKRENRPCPFEDPTVLRVARDNCLSIAQVNMQWIHQQPLSYVVRCDNIRQLKENLAASKTTILPIEDLIDLDTLNRDVRIYYFDEHKGVEKHREYPFKKAIEEQHHQAGDRHDLTYGIGVST